MVLMRKDVLYECVKRYVKKRKEDPYAFFTQSLRTRKFNFSCCVKNTVLIFLEMFLIECCTVLVKPPMTSSLYSPKRNYL